MRSSGAGSVTEREEGSMAMEYILDRGRRKWGGTAALAVALLAAAPAPACGPDFPAGYFVHNVRDYRQMPPAWFPRELHALLGLATLPEPAESPAAAACDRVVDADLAQLEAVLRAAGASDGETAPMLAEYRKMRCATRETGKRMDEWEGELRSYDRRKEYRADPGPEPPKPAAFDPTPYEVLLNRLPVEFSLYARGAAAYHSRNLDSALDLFMQVLALPAEERPFRTIWAAHMLGMTLMRMKEYDTARAAFDRVPTLAGEGFADPMGLSEGVGGWKAMTHYQAGDFAGAAKGYLSEYMDGDAARRHTALISLDWAFSRAADEHAPAQIAALLEDENARMALLAWSLANPSESRDIIEPVLAHFDALPGPVPGADRIAWLAYNSGDMAKAAKWAEKAGDASPLAAWVRAKLLMREGRITEAAAVLEQVLALLEKRPAEGASAPPEWLQYQEDELAEYLPFDVAQRVREEWSVLWARKKEKTPEESDKALKYLDGYDRSYVAEVAMTTEELLAHVFQDPANGPERREGAGEGTAGILLRRLVREGRLEDAARLFPESDAPRLLGVLREGRNPAAPKRERAERLMEAAEITASGELHATALCPDWWNSEPFRTYLHGSCGREDLPVPNRKDHFLYPAADLMWEAATLLPNNDVLTARALYTGGMWLRFRDPPAADRFYKALVRRNPNLAVAREADRLRWFPQEFDERVLYTPRPPSWLRGRRRILLAVFGCAAALCALVGAVVFVRLKTSKFPSLNGTLPL